jgi:hypothetical protein
LPVMLVRQRDRLRQGFSVPAVRKVPNGPRISEVPEAARDSLSWIHAETRRKRQAATLGPTLVAQRSQLVRKMRNSRLELIRTRRWCRNIMWPQAQSVIMKVKQTVGRSRFSGNSR